MVNLSPPGTRSKFLLMTMTTTAMILTAAVAFEHGDHTCMYCPCGEGGCSSNSAYCCDRFSPYSLETLRVDVNCSRPGHSHVIEPVYSAHGGLQSHTSNCTGFHIVHESSCLTDFPNDYCRYSETRAISMSYNALLNFPDLKCLPKLGMLDLKHNNLTHLPRNAFKGLKYIRDIFLDYNQISYIHPLAFDVDMTELARFSVSHNRLMTIEAWPMALHYSFCYFDFSYNLVHHFTNQAHFKFNISLAVTYGPGYVDFSHNLIQDGPSEEIRRFGITNILQLAKLMRWGFDFRHNPFRCDCKMYEVALWIGKLSKVMWRDYFNITCGNPPRLRGIPVLHVPRDQLTCDIITDCPRGCHCLDKPSDLVIIVQCDDVSMDTLPDVMPEGSDLRLHLANNSLRQLPPRQYLSRAKIVDLNGNGLKHIKENTPGLLRHAELVDLRNNELEHLPSSFQALDPKAILLDPNTLKCSCKLKWFPDWLQHSSDHHLDSVTCTKEDGQRLMLSNVTKDDLCDSRPVEPHSGFKFSLIGALGLVVVVASVLAVFRYEAMVVVQRLAARRASKKKLQR